MIGASMDLKNFWDEIFYLLVAGDWYLLIDHNCTDLTRQDGFEVREDKIITPCGLLKWTYYTLVGPTSCIYVHCLMAEKKEVSPFSCPRERAYLVRPTFIKERYL